MAQYLTQQDVQDYGNDLVNFAQRAALHSVAPHLQNLEQQNYELQRRLAQEARHRLDAAVEQAIPNYRTIDQDPRWHQFLLTVDSLSGRQRQTLLNDAIASADANRVIAFFRTFLREAAGADHTAGHASNTSSYGTRRATSGVNGQVYTASQIAKLYDQKRRGAYAGREAEWAHQEADIFRAQHEGRVVGGRDVAGK